MDGLGFRSEVCGGSVQMGEQLGFHRVGGGFSGQFAGGGDDVAVSKPGGLVEGAGGFQPNGNFSAWLIGIARHRAIDMTRSRRYRARAREGVLDEHVAGATDTSTDALLLQTVVHAALAELPSTQREAIELAYYGGLTHVEIATRLGEPVGTVKSRMRLALTRLRKLLRAAQD